MVSASVVHRERIAGGTCGSEAPPKSAISAIAPEPASESGDDDERDQRRQVHHRRGAQHAALAVAVHQPPLGDRAERVGDAEGADHVARLGVRAGGLARQQQDREAEHADRHRAGDRQQHRRTGARQIQDLPVPLPSPAHALAR